MRGLIWPAIGGSLRQARPARRGPQPRDVRGRGRQRDHHASTSSPRSCPAAAIRPSSACVSGWLWFTVLFANFAEAMAEGRGKAQADTLRRTKTETLANRRGRRRRRGRSPAARAAQGRRRGRRRRRDHPRRRRRHRGHRLGGRVGDHRRVGAGHPRERRRPQRRHRRHARCSPTGSRCASPPTPGETFLDRMIALVEGAERQKTPNEIALDILLAGLTIIFLHRDRDAAAVRDLQRCAPSR